MGETMTFSDEEFLDMKKLLCEERVKDVGSLIEAITEQPDETLKLLGRLIWDNQTSTHTISIGAIFSKIVIDYCKPTEELIIEKLEKAKWKQHF